MSKTIKLKQEQKPEKVKTTYDEKSPLTGNFSVLVEKVETDKPGELDTYKICMDTGYQTYWETWKDENTELIQNLEKQMPSYIVSHKYVDSHKRVWYPMLTISYFATLYPIVDELNQLKWSVATIKMATSEAELEGKRVVQLPVLNDEKTVMAYFVIDDATATVWDMHQFESAFDSYQLIVSESSQQQLNEQ